MLRIEEELFDEGIVRKEVNFRSNTDLVIRRAWFDATNKIVADTIFEYDDKGRCLYGIVVDQFCKVAGTYEHIYVDGSCNPAESIERDANGEILNKKVYKKDATGRPIQIEIFDREKKVAYGGIYYDEEGEYSHADCLDLAGNEIESLNLTTIMMLLGIYGTTQTK